MIYNDTDGGEMEFFSSYKMSTFPWRKTYWLYRGESVTFVAVKRGVEFSLRSLYLVVSRFIRQDFPGEFSLLRSLYITGISPRGTRDKYILNQRFVNTVLRVKFSSRNNRLIGLVSNAN